MLIDAVSDVEAKEQLSATQHDAHDKDSVRDLMKDWAAVNKHRMTHLLVSVECWSTVGLLWEREVRISEEDVKGEKNGRDDHVGRLRQRASVKHDPSEQ